MKRFENEEPETDLLLMSDTANHLSGPGDEEEDDDLGEDLNDEDINADDYDDEDEDPDLTTENNGLDDFDQIDRPDSGLDEDAPDTDSL